MRQIFNLSNFHKLTAIKVNQGTVESRWNIFCKHGVHPSSRVQRLGESLTRSPEGIFVVDQHQLYVGFSFNFSLICTAHPKDFDLNTEKMSHNLDISPMAAVQDLFYCPLPMCLKMTSSVQTVSLLFNLKKNWLHTIN